MSGHYQIEFLEGVTFKRFLKKFPERHQHLIVEAIQIELADFVPALSNQQNIRPLGKGLFELKIKSTGELLVRIFFAFAENRTIWIVHFYDKKANDSVRFQSKQIQVALAKIKNSSII
jgi:phage-related protein